MHLMYIKKKNSFYVDAYLKKSHFRLGDFRLFHLFVINPNITSFF